MPAHSSATPSTAPPPLSWQNGVTVSWDELAPGDLVFFKKPGSTTSKPVTHVGMYIGSGQFVHASDYGVGVIVSNLSDAYYTTG